ncbi:hypothetical protein [Caulobacter sp. 17J65-9]|uniref:hypothetical protein n=1 Tax=Caulobacter sp. 17J65-9 TaxID=2709382 RepID=UPI0013C9446E|nr:hypothetical protein [Caulobacter sp. 17J65-9]NEX91912.1 hypothetical protein [Caulobacter sp. 17J65-9]
MSPDSSNEPVDVRLTADEALVLFDLLSRWTEGADVARPTPEMFETSAEPIALVGLLSQLQKQLVAPFERDFAEQVDRARARLMASYGEDFQLGA